MHATYTQQSCTEAVINQDKCALEARKKKPDLRFTLENHRRDLTCKTRCYAENVAFVAFAGSHSVQTIHIKLRSQLVPKRVKQLQITKIICALFIISARNVASPMVTNVDPSGRTASAATMGLVWTSLIFFSLSSPSPSGFFFLRQSISLLLLSLFLHRPLLPNH